MFGDIKAYKRFEPEYNDWKKARNAAEQKRQDYLEENPWAVNEEDVKRGEVLIRAVNTMDEYSQRNAENMEMATETVSGWVTSLIYGASIPLALALAKNKKVFSAVEKCLKKVIPNVDSFVTGTVLVNGVGLASATVAGMFLNPLAAKAEISASRRGRFEAMRTELADPKAFAMLDEEQAKAVEEYIENNRDKAPKENDKQTIKESTKLVKEYLFKSDVYNKQRKEFNDAIAEHDANFDKELTPEKIEDAKRDQQLLTKIVEKIDIASQDYAENAELATSSLVTGVFAFGALLDLGVSKLLKVCKVKNANAFSLVPKALTLLGTISACVMQASIQKEASRIGRYKIKQELLNNPEQLVYVSDEKTAEMPDVEGTLDKKPGFFKFLKNVWKDKKEYDKYKKEVLPSEKLYHKAVENIEMSEEQLEEAKRLQRNTFLTFNKVDDNSQKYSESVEALGNTIAYPLVTISSLAGMALGLKFLTKPSKSAIATAGNFGKYIMMVLGSTLPAIGINAIVTQKQKRASRVADMVSINELQDYRKFADYSKYTEKQPENI